MILPAFRSTKVFSLVTNFQKQQIIFFFAQYKDQYPYKFGGLPALSFYNFGKAQEFQKQMFSPQIKETFIDLYRKYLIALQSKDMEFLNQRVQKGLLEGIGNIETKIVNKNSPIEVGVDSNSVIGQIGFQRLFHGEQMKKRKSPAGYEQAIDHFQGYSLNPDKDYDLISLFSTKIYFRSEIKLEKVNCEGNNSKSPQVHLIQFEVEHKWSKWELLLRNFVYRILYFKNKQKQRKAMMWKMLGVSRSSFWRIADVDSIKNGNLPKAVNQLTSEKQRK